MLNKFKNAFYNAVSGGIDAVPLTKDTDHKEDSKTLSHKFPYTRPHFLQLNVDEEVQLSADKQIRPIIVPRPRDISKLPWNSGYAEAVNAGKSVRNEDQACMRRAILQHPESRDNLTLRSATFETSEANNPAMCLPYVYFSVFDGHAGAGAALAAANQLHHIIHEKLVDIIDHLLPPLDGIPAHQVESTSRRGVAMWFPEKEVSKEALIVGALESAFWEMDNLIAGDRKKFNIKGGCTALVSLFILGKVYIANAGDSRAVLVKGKVATAMSNDFTPESERGRVRRLAALQPHLLGGEFTHLDFKRRPLAKDLGKRVLYRDAHMMGWAYKTVTQEDLKIPVVHGEGKRSRVLATIGVTRGFGDHDLKALNCNIPVKPFLLSQPEVHILDVTKEDLVLTDTDVLLMGTDGLWDVTTNDRAAEILQKSFDHFPSSDTQRLKYRFTSAAQDLVMQSRGKLYERSWRTSEGKPASTDDISVFVIPLTPYKEEYATWKRDYDGIRGMYDNEKDTSEGFGKLSLRTSPVASEKMSPHFEPQSRHHTYDTSPLDNSDIVCKGPNGVIVNGWEEKPTTEMKTVEKKNLDQKPGSEPTHKNYNSSTGKEIASGSLGGKSELVDSKPSVIPKKIGRALMSAPSSSLMVEADQPEPTHKNYNSSTGKEIVSGSLGGKSELVDSKPAVIPKTIGRALMLSARKFEVASNSSSLLVEADQPQHDAKSGGIAVGQTDHDIGTSGTVDTQPERNAESGVVVVAQTDDDVYLGTMSTLPENNAGSGVIMVAQTDLTFGGSGTVATQPEHDSISDGGEVSNTENESHDPVTEPQPNVDATATAGINLDSTPNTQVTSISDTTDKP